MQLIPLYCSSCVPHPQLEESACFVRVEDMKISEKVNKVTVLQGQHERVVQRIATYQAGKNIGAVSVVSGVCEAS